MAITRLKLGYLNDIADGYSADTEITDFDLKMLTATSKSIAKAGNVDKAQRLLLNIDSSKIKEFDRIIDRYKKDLLGFFRYLNTSLVFLPFTSEVLNIIPEAVEQDF